MAVKNSRPLETSDIPTRSGNFLDCMSVILSHQDGENRAGLSDARLSAATRLSSYRLVSVAIMKAHFSKSVPLIIENISGLYHLGQETNIVLRVPVEVRNTSKRAWVDTNSEVI